MKWVLLVVLQYFTLVIYGQFVHINEIVSKNENGLLDEDGDYSDWIELYNSSSVPQNLDPYLISDENVTWNIPNITIQPYSYLILFASGKDRKSGELHTNFKIDSEGENISLSIDNQLISTVIIPELAEYQSFSAVPDGSDNYFVVETISPNEENSRTDILLFSNEEGFYQSEVTLDIESVLGHTIRYTIDSSDPTKNSPVFSDNLILTKNRRENKFCEIPSTVNQSELTYKAWTSPESNINKCHIIKAASFLNGDIQSEIFTKSYFIDAPIYDIPVFSLVIDSTDLFSDSTGIYVPGIHFRSEKPEWTGNYFEIGIDWEKPVYASFFNNNEDLSFSQQLGVRIHGGKTRHAAQKSLKFYTREEYGERIIDFPLFEDRNVEKYKRFILRTIMGSWGETIINDVLGRQLIQDLDVDHQKSELVVVYLNGEYWGIYQLTERQDEHYIEYLYGIDVDDVDIVGFWDTKLNNLYNIVETQDYEQINSILDIASFIDYYLAQMFFANNDWPDNNSKLWSSSTDIKWRYLYYDIDGGFRRSDYNMYEDLHELADEKSTRLFRTLARMPRFKEEFLSRLSYLLQNNFSKQNMLGKVQSIVSDHKPLLKDYIERWQYPESIPDWEKDIETDLIKFIEERPCYFIDQTIEYFSLDSFYPTCGDLDEIEIPELVTITPTTCTDYFEIRNNTSTAYTYNMDIFNCSGQLVIKNSNLNIPSYGIINIDLDLSAGYYIVQLYNSYHSHRYKIVVYK